MGKGVIAGRSKHEGSRAGAKGLGGAEGWAYPPSRKLSFIIK